ncbi:MAG TPA: fumarylacetoacetate hydrolase family protein [Pseudomonadota bacterium]|jgi:2-keto-4-pentenoate hydratase/2-oxohepta-3-ene-1,7-dioic acid hydratase in catechol pathway|nr:fumarylacetoacetate hydrolase family protein [Pseudomonadota bacterium]
MLLLRLFQKPDRAPRFGRVLEDEPDVVELLDGDPLLGGMPTGERLPFTPMEWQQDPDGSDIELLVPVVPQKIIGIGSNYKNHTREMGKPIPAEPLLFLKPPSALLSPGRPIARPAGFERCDYEGELAVVIGRRCHKQSVAHALNFVLGYTLCNDVTVRDLQKKDGQFTRAKGFDTFCPLGPVISTDVDPAQSAVRSHLNGKLVQDGQTDELIFGVAELVSFVSQVMTLEPGDVISTGTPAGVGNLTPGDIIAISADGIGCLQNPVVQGPALPALSART